VTPDRKSPLHDPQRRSFASDNYAGAHPEVLDAIAAANGGHQSSYGADAYTARLAEVVRNHFGARAEVFPVFNGTAANVLSLQAMCQPWEAVICSDNAHAHMDEGGAPEKVAGLKLLTVPHVDGKVTPELVDRQAWGFGNEHRAQPRVVSITQSTELGTVYTPEEIAALADHAHGKGMLVHLDGARISIAAAALDLPLSAFTTDVGVDVVSYGGTKNGALLGEAVVVCNPDAVRGLRFLRKSTMQLSSKMRFLSAQLVALLDGDLWLRNARHARAMAARLEAAVRAAGVEIAYPVQANAVFAVLPADVADRVREEFFFYTWDEATGVMRLMTAFDTTEADVDAFGAALAAAMRGR
jgi:threonine aldolase